MKRTTIAGSVAAIAVGIGTGLMWPSDEHGTTSARTAVDSEQVRPTTRRQATSIARVTAVPAGGPVLLKSESIIRDPTAPGYDARALLRSGELTIPEIYEMEPRDPEFAEPREQYLNRVIRNAVTATRIGEMVDDISVDCRTATCWIELTTGREDAESVHYEVEVYPWGDSVQPGIDSDPDDPGRSRVRMAVAYGNKHRDEGAFREWFERVRVGKGLAVAGAEE